MPGSAMTKSSMGASFSLLVLSFFAFSVMRCFAHNNLLKNEQKEVVVDSENVEELSEKLSSISSGEGENHGNNLHNIETMRSIAASDLERLAENEIVTKAADKQVPHLAEVAKGRGKTVGTDVSAVPALAGSKTSLQSDMGIQEVVSENFAEHEQHHALVNPDGSVSAGQNSLQKNYLEIYDRRDDNDDDQHKKQSLLTGDDFNNDPMETIVTRRQAGGLRKKKDIIPFSAPIQTEADHTPPMMSPPGTAAPTTAAALLAANEGTNDAETRHTISSGVTKTKQNKKEKPEEEISQVVSQARTVDQYRNTTGVHHFATHKNYLRESGDILLEQSSVRSGISGGDFAGPEPLVRWANKKAEGSSSVDEQKILGDAVSAVSAAFPMHGKLLQILGTAVSAAFESAERNLVELLVTGKNRKCLESQTDIIRELQKRSEDVTTSSVVAECHVMVEEHKFYVSLSSQFPKPEELEQLQSDRLPSPQYIKLLLDDNVVRKMIPTSGSAKQAGELVDRGGSNRFLWDGIRKGSWRRVVRKYGFVTERNRVEKIGRTSGWHPWNSKENPKIELLYDLRAGRFSTVRASWETIDESDDKSSFQLPQEWHLMTIADAGGKCTMMTPDDRITDAIHGFVIDVAKNLGTGGTGPLTQAVSVGGVSKQIEFVQQELGSSQTNMVCLCCQPDPRNIREFHEDAAGGYNWVTQKGNALSTMLTDKGT